jgi:peptide deformylase
MTIRKIRCVPDTVLRRKAKRVPSVDRGIQALIDDMIETLHEASGAGLAAPQVGVSLRLVVVQMPEQEPLVLINPEVVKRQGEREIEEGCLSIPGYRGMVKRSLNVTVKALDRQGKEFRIKGDDLLGQCLEHELDHLNGILYTDILIENTKLRKLEPDEDEEETGFKPAARAGSSKEARPNANGTTNRSAV